MKATLVAVWTAFGLIAIGCEERPRTQPARAAQTQPAPVEGKTVRTDAEWRKQLTPQQYHVTCQKGTERAFTGKYWNTKDKGVYHCVRCGHTLFGSETKYDSGSGWPSFHSPASAQAVTTKPDTSHGMTRTEVVCSKCGAHLGHVFDDGPKPTGLRYCINSASLNLVKEAGTE